MRSTTSFAEMLEAVARGTAESRRQLSLLAGETRASFVRDYVANLQVSRSDRDDVEASSSAAAALRVLWGAVPEKLFTSSNPDFESLAKIAAGHCGEDLGVDAIHDIATVFRRIRLHFEDASQARASCRSRSSTLRKLLRDQQGRCALCNYYFTEDILSDAEYEGDVECVRVRHIMAAEVAVNLQFAGGEWKSHMARRPEIDHIIPLFLGGDTVDNLQVLCRVCNQGKAEDVLGPGLYVFAAGNRPSEHRSVSLKKRFLVLARHAVHHGGSAIDGERRLFYENPDFLPTYGNIKVVVVD